MAFGGKSVLSGDQDSFTYQSSYSPELIRVLGSGFTYQGGYAVGGTATILIGTTTGTFDFEARIGQASVAAYSTLSPSDQIARTFQGNDYIQANTNAATNDVLKGGAGNDFLVGGGGSDIVDGGAGDDTLQFNFKRGDAQVGHDAAGRLIVDGPNGNHKVITNVEHFLFTDGSVDQSNFGVQKAVVKDAFRFFDTHDGGHFFTTSAAERDQVLATRPDLKLEGVGFQAFDGTQVANSAPVFRFFDTHDGGHFFTISTTERDQVLATRPDLKFEGVGFYEFQASQGASSDAVYRFFDTHDGGHFFTSSAVERDQVLATRPDLKFEGVAFYAPHSGTDFFV